MRGPWLWVVVIVAGIVAVTGVVALVGRDDSEDQTVAAGEWADTVCGAVAVWRGQIESIVDGIRDPDASGSLGVEEPQSETPQGRTTFIRDGLETAVIGDKVPGLDMISFGPQIEAPHSPDERVSIPTVERFWRLLVGFVDELSMPGKEA